MIDRGELKKILPYGSGKLIAHKAGVSLQSVSNYFSGKNNSERIEVAALEVAAELSNKKRNLIALIVAD